MTEHLTDVQKRKRLKMIRRKKSKHFIREVTQGGKMREKWIQAIFFCFECWYVGLKLTKRHKGRTLIFITNTLNGCNQSLSKRRKKKRTNYFENHLKYLQGEGLSRQGETEVISNDKNVWKGIKLRVWISVTFWTTVCSHWTGSRQVLQHSFWLTN